MSVHIHQTHNGALTGNFQGATTEEEAREYVNRMRHARDTSPVYAAFRDGYDWHLVTFAEDGNSWAVRY